MKKWLLYQIPNTKYVFFQKDVQSVQMSVIMFKIHCFEADHPAEGGIFVNWYELIVVLWRLVETVETQHWDQICHQAISWTNIYISSVRSSDIHLRETSQGMPQPSITEMSLIITYLKDVMTWKHLPLYCSSERGIHWPPVDSNHKGTALRSFDIFSG